MVTTKAQVQVLTLWMLPLEYIAVLGHPHNAILQLKLKPEKTHFSIVKVTRFNKNEINIQQKKKKTEK